MKLTDSQLVILSSAANRDGGTTLPLPKSTKLNKGAATLVLKSLLKQKLVVEQPARNEVQAWREDKQGRRFALVITPAGLEALGVQEASDAKTPVRARKATRASAKGRDVKKSKPTVRSGSKLSILIELLSRKNGATLEEAAKVTGWQHHSIRGAMSGALKKKMGLKIGSSVTGDRGRVYRIGAGS
jgi:hypothetical protein